LHTTQRQNQSQLRRQIAQAKVAINNNKRRNIEFENNLMEQFKNDDTLVTAFPRIHVPTSTDLKKVKKIQQGKQRDLYDHQIVEKNQLKEQEVRRDQ